ncbi:hypothetical protein KPH14_003764 [Odynerus spinipes]|uniref:Uncharacterized protein n=1 Tax=Odynerus spinipes TaxID=1348599 RepID=A0AAD9VUM2_9HYME|nr:hypothetical protein KPH14_003764 [Odynerus spinipes]
MTPMPGNALTKQYLCYVSSIACPLRRQKDQGTMGKSIGIALSDSRLVSPLERLKPSRTSITTGESRSFSIGDDRGDPIGCRDSPSVQPWDLGLNCWDEVHELRNGLRRVTIGIRSSARSCVISVIDSDSVPQCSGECAFMVTHVLGGIRVEPPLDS